MYFWVGLVPLVVGWWDQGHMTIASIASILSTDTVVADINEILEAWSDANGLTSMVSSAIWLDRLKCLSIEEGCGGIPEFQLMTLLNTFHYDSIHVNATHPAHGVTGASYALKTITANMNHVEKMKGRPYSVMSANLLLRAFIHIVGDIHQPLHASTYYSSSIPLGDSGGCLIPITGPLADSLQQKGVTNLHEIWDTVGSVLHGSWPGVGVEETAAVAQGLLDRYENIEVKPLKPWEISTESHTLAHIAYSCLEVVNGRVVCHATDEYLEKVYNTTTRQLVVAGHRLAQYLESHSHAIRFMASTPRMLSVDTPPPPRHLILIGGILAGVLLTSSLQVLWKCTTRRKRDIGSWELPEPLISITGGKKIYA